MPICCAPRTTTPAPSATYELNKATPLKLQLYLYVALDHWLNHLPNKKTKKLYTQKDCAPHKSHLLRNCMHFFFNF